MYTFLPPLLSKSTHKAEGMRKLSHEFHDCGSVGETDWKAELEAFGKGVREDANEVQQHAHKAAKVGASRLENLPQQAASARFPRVDPDKFKNQFDQVFPVIIVESHRLLCQSRKQRR